MKTTDTFKFLDRECKFSVGFYNNGNWALSIVEAETECPMCVCTINTGYMVKDEYVSIKDYSENTGMVKFLVGLGIIKPECSSEISSGWVTIPIHELTESGIELFNEAFNPNNEGK